MRTVNSVSGLSMRVVSTALLLAGMSSDLHSQDSLKISLDAGLVFSTFQQQVKSKVGDPRGERLVNETEVGVFASGTYRVTDCIGAGLFLQYDRGNRHAARFAGFDPVTGKTQTSGDLGGDYTEFWLGPLVRASWKGLFIEGGYGLIGIRTDEGRRDLVTASGDSTSSFSVNPIISWYGSIGGAVPIVDRWSIVFRLTYRLRYYDERGGTMFAGTMEHGSQNITPFIGVQWRL